MIVLARAAAVVSVLATIPLAPARSAVLTDLPADQQRVASCMLSVVRSVRGVTDAELRFADHAIGATSRRSVQTYLDYTYHHRSRIVSPRASPQEIDITQIISTKKGGFSLGGLTSTSAPDLDDNDSGMLRITDAWRKQCGLNLFVITD
jgi:hypothetical protein